MMIRLLVAEADTAARESAVALLRQLVPDALIAEAGSYTEAADHILALQPQAALVALRLGERSGLELVERLLAAGLTTVFAVTAPVEDAQLIRRAMHAGARDYLCTPLQAWEVREFLRRTLPTGPESEEHPSDPILHREYASFSPLITQVLLMAHKGYSNPPVNLISVAESLHMNGKYVGRVFLRETGMKFSQYLLACRMDEARRLVESTREKVSVIAAMVGYNQLNRFYVHFKNYYGISPGALRRDGLPEGAGKADQP